MLEKTYAQLQLRFTPDFKNAVFVHEVCDDMIYCGKLSIVTIDGSYIAL